MLLAGDDAFVRAYVVSCLESLGYRVIAAVDGQEALTRLAEGAIPDVLFTDIVMPGGISGWELAERPSIACPASFRSPRSQQALPQGRICLALARGA